MSRKMTRPGSRRPDATAEREQACADLERRMKEVLGVKVQITAVGKGELDKYTMTSQTSKVKRLLDRRK